MKRPHTPTTARGATRTGAIAIMAAIAALGVCVVSFAFLFANDPTTAFHEFHPGMDGRPEGTTVPTTSDGRAIRIGEHFRRYTEAPAEPLPGSWPRFRGAAHDNVCTDGVAIATAWTNGTPPVRWSVELGEGHAGAAIFDSRVYLMDYDEQGQADALRCFDLANGRELWRRWYTVPVKRNHGMSRTVPAVTDKYIVTIGPRCHVMCLDRATGDLRWGLRLAEDHGANEPLWYTAQCPLIDDGVAVLAPCGTNLMMGLDCASGDVLWRTPNTNAYKMSHSSILPTILHGKRMYLYAAVGGIVGVSAEPEDRGTLLWESREFSASVVAPSPVHLGDGRIFLTAGYGAGSILLNVTRNADATFAVTTVYRHTPKEGLACEQHTPLVRDGHLVGILPKDAGANRKQLICYHPDKGIVWQSGKSVRFGLGPFMIVDDKLLVLDDDGTLTIATFSLDSFTPLVQTRILDGHDSWAPLAMAEGLLVARDSTRMVCVDLRTP